MEWPSWTSFSTDSDLDKLYFTDSDETPTTPRACQALQAYRLKKDTDNDPVEIKSFSLQDDSLLSWASSSLVPESGPALLWGFRLLFREPMTEAERNIVAPEDLFDLISSFDLSYFCFKRETLKVLIKGLKLPERLLAIVCNLGDESVFSFAGNKRWMKYVLRTERRLPDDLVLAVHWDESDALVTTFLHGCTQEEATRISDWFDRTKVALKHPLLPAVVLAEIQLERHSRIYRRYYDRYMLLLNEIKSRSEQIQTKKTNLDESGGLEVAKWLAAIFQMYHKHRHFHQVLGSFRRILDSLVETSDTYRESVEEINITCRLREISHQYEDLVGQSNIMADGASLLLTTVWSLISQRDSQLAQEANTLNQRIADSSRLIAEATGRDSAAMKALAFITMIFLPATGIAAIFSMPIFDWTKYSHSAYVRRSIWIYCVTSGVLTLNVLYIWRFWYLRDIWQREKNNRIHERLGRTDLTLAPLHYPVVDQLLLRGHDKRRKSLEK